MNGFVHSRPNIEDLVTSIIRKNYPEIASAGVLNDTVENPPQGATVVTNLESSGGNAKELFIWGTSRWGGARVAG
jgi:hypothetical protein